MRLFVCKNNPVAEKLARKSGQRAKNNLKGYIADEMMDVLEELRDPTLLNDNTDVDESENEMLGQEEQHSAHTFSC